MRAIAGFSLVGLLALGTVVGCGPNLSEEDLGTVVTDMSDVPGADEPYDLPPLDASPSSEPEDSPAETGL